MYALPTAAISDIGANTMGPKPYPITKRVNGRVATISETPKASCISYTPGVYIAEPIYSASVKNETSNMKKDFW